MQSLPDPDLSEKVASLRRPDAWPEAPGTIETIETHFAWVFLSDRYVYKLKKPVRFPDFDLTESQARRAMCELEIALNRRLAAETYLEVVPLGRSGSGLRLECERDPVDWLVKMRRLPDETTLERRLPTLEPDDPCLTRLLALLCAFYRRTARAFWSSAEYVSFLKEQSTRSARLLMTAGLEAERDRVIGIADLQIEFAERQAALLGQRIAEGRVCDAHGDLRPEHVFLTDKPQIIDCLEFSAMLRQLDAAEEITFLALECERLGRADIGARLVELYVQSCDDAVPHELIDYYRSQRALIRAFLCAWHVEDGLSDELARHWLGQARWYIDRAGSSIDAAIGRARGVPT